MKTIKKGASLRTLHKEEEELVPGKDYLEIELTQGFKAKISPIDIDLALFNWHAHVDNRNGECYACHTIRIGGKKIRYWLHNEVMEKVLGRELRKGEIVDHINHDKLDCRRENLRLSDASKNQANIKKARSGKRFKGVYWNKKAKKWMAMVTKEGKTHYLGLFEDEVEAAKAYNAKAYELFGDYAYLNNIEEPDEIL